MKKALSIVIAGLSLAGCGAGSGSVSVQRESSLLEAQADVPEPPPAEEAVVHRPDLDAILDEGPAALLARVETAPHRTEGRFVGFAIVSYRDGQPSIPDIRPGDVVVSVNDRGIERPERYLEVFEALRGADEIRFEILRDGMRHMLVYPIVP